MWHSPWSTRKLEENKILSGAQTEQGLESYLRKKNIRGILWDSALLVLGSHIFRVDPEVFERIHRNQNLPNISLGKNKKGGKAGGFLEFSEWGMQLNAYINTNTQIHFKGMLFILTNYWGHSFSVVIFKALSLIIWGKWALSGLWSSSLAAIYSPSST